MFSAVDLDTEGQKNDTHKYAKMCKKVILVKEGKWGHGYFN